MDWFIILKDYVPVISTSIAAIGLILTAIKLDKDSNVRQFQLLEGIFKDIRELEQLYYEKYENLPQEERTHWDSLFFNTLEWFAFLINENQITEQKLIGFFREAILYWHDTIYLKHYPESKIKDEKHFPEFKKLFNKLKGSS